MNLNDTKKLFPNPAALRWYTSMELIPRCIFYVPSADSDRTVTWGGIFFTGKEGCGLHDMIVFGVT